jgi:hypothetical protein
MQSASCAICESPMRAEIEKLDSEGKPDSTIQWARKQGINISRFSLLKHRTNHLASMRPGDNGNNKAPDPTNSDDIVRLRPISNPTKEPSHLLTRKPSAKKHDKNMIDNSGNGSLAHSGNLSTESANKSPDPLLPTVKLVSNKLPEKITDQLLLDTVRDQVYQKLIDGQIKLDIGDCFKAIEIKYKIAEESQNEKLLLEILSEIRSQELAG